MARRNGGSRTAPKDLVSDELTRIMEDSPELAEAASFYQKALPKLRLARQSFPPVQMDANTASNKIDAGLPLLVGEELPFDLADKSSQAVQSARSLFLDLCGILEQTSVQNTSSSHKQPGRSGSRLDLFSLWKRAQDGDGMSLRAAAARQIRRAVESGEIDLTAAWEMLAGGQRGRLELTAVGLKLDVDLLLTLAQASIKPAFQRWAQELSDLVEFDHWQRGYCPVCGSPASLSEIQGKEGARRLRCGFCAAGWRYPHLRCVFCKNEDYKLLSYISAEGEEDRYKVHCCDVCRGYIKGIKTFEPIPVDMLAVQDLATLHLDIIASERGYTRIPANQAIMG